MSDWRPAGGKESTGTICYFDLVEGAWRSFSKGNLRGIAVADFGTGALLDRYSVSEDYAIRYAIKLALEKNYVNRVRELIDHLLFGLAPDTKILVTLADESRKDNLEDTASKIFEKILDECTARSKEDILEEMRITQRHMDDLIQELSEID